MTTIVSFSIITLERSTRSVIKKQRVKKQKLRCWRERKGHRNRPTPRQIQHHSVPVPARQRRSARDVIPLPDGFADAAVDAGGGGPLHQGLFPRPPHQDRRQGNLSPISDAYSILAPRPCMLEDEVGIRLRACLIQVILGSGNLE
jgi:hypothetical protein